jgi:hypothetical protein
MACPGEAGADWPHAWRAAQDDDSDHAIGHARRKLHRDSPAHRVPDKHERPRRRAERLIDGSQRAEDGRLIERAEVRGVAVTGQVEAETVEAGGRERRAQRLEVAAVAPASRRGCGMRRSCHAGGMARRSAMGGREAKTLWRLGCVSGAHRNPCKSTTMGRGLLHVELAHDSVCAMCIIVGTAHTSGFREKAQVPKRYDL